MARGTIDDYRPAPDDSGLPLFAAPAQRHSAPSVEAAADQTPAKAGGDRLRILQVLERLGPLTDEEIATQTQMGLNTVRPRRGELVKAGQVVAVDENGRTRAGKRATRWGRA
jgi:hypothetical protein